MVEEEAAFLVQEVDHHKEGSQIKGHKCTARKRNYPYATSF
jgi:hypothetical protein